MLARNVPCPPCNIGPLSTPNYASLASAAIYALPGGRQVFAGQRAEAFFVDLGSIFELGTLRPIANLHATFGLPGLAAMPGVNSTGGRQRAQHRDSGSHHGHCVRQRGADELGGHQIERGHLDDGESTQGPRAGVIGRRRRRDGTVRASLAARQSALQRGASNT